MRSLWRAYPALVCAIGLSACGGSTPSGPTPGPPTPPPVPALTLTCPSAPTGTSRNNQPAVVTWADPTAAGGSAPYAIACTPSSGSPFAPGSTPVACQAVDAAARTATCSFQVTVTWVPQIAVGRFLGFGDSMTAGTVSPAPFVLIQSPESYPFKLGQLLSARYLDQTTVVYNDGWPGEFVDVGSARLRGSLSQNAPDVVMLWEGANDLLACRDRIDFNFDLDECLEKEALPIIIGGLRDQVEISKEMGVRVLLATHPPQRKGGTPNRGAAADWVPALNSRIAALAASERVTLVDLYAAFPTDTRTLVGMDGLHLTEAGYALVADVFFDAIRELYEVPYPSPGPTAFR